jgi:long-chain acyl-CoA synthetase
MERSWLRFYESGVPKELKYPEDILLCQFIKDSARKYPDNTACIFFGKRISYKLLYEYIEKLANSLKNLGIGEGTKVGLHLPNCPQFIISFYSVLSLGGIIVQMNPLYTERELEHILNDSQATHIITLDILYHRINKIKKKTNLKYVIITSLKEFLPFPLSFIYPLKFRPKEKIKFSESTVKFSELLKTEPKSIEFTANPKEAIALIQYTGGTTGIPKGAMLSHYNLIANTLQIVSWITDLNPGNEIILGVLPFFHVYGMSAVLNLGTYIGASIILVPKFSSKEVLRLISRYKPTLFPGVPAMYIALCENKKIKKYNLSSLRVCISGAAPLPVKVKERFEELTKAKLIEGYGLSEASPVTHINPINGLNKPQSIGIPIPDTEAKIVDIDEGKKELAVGELGELIIRGPQIMKGYLNKPKETEDTIRNGWLYTGDIAKVDEDGYFYIMDRKKELILSATGFNVYPREVEEVLYSHPKVKEAAVLGIPSEKTGEIIKAFIVLKEGESCTQQEIKDFCKQHLAKYKIPQEIEFRESLPKSLVGKILKRVLLESLQQ